MSWEQRQRRWYHNSLLGHCAMGMMQMLAISKCRTASPEAKRLAEHIRGQLSLLDKELRDHRHDD